MFVILIVNQTLQTTVTETLQTRLDKALQENKELRKEVQDFRAEKSGQSHAAFWLQRENEIRIADLSTLATETVGSMLQGLRILGNTWVKDYPHLAPKKGCWGCGQSSHNLAKCTLPRKVNVCFRCGTRFSTTLDCFRCPRIELIRRLIKDLERRGNAERDTEDLLA